jgi:hypothetical protein
MTKTTLGLFNRANYLGLLAAVLTLAGSMASSHAGQLVPYKGHVWGAITTDQTLAVLSAGAEEISSHLGRGTQRFEDLVIEIAPDGNGVTHLASSGTGIATAANGDQLRFYFELEGCMRDGVIAYTGNYQITPGGTGEFQFAGERAGLGSGFIEGTAWVVPSSAPGTLCILFDHEFAGDILRAAKPPAKGGK